MDNPNWRPGQARPDGVIPENVDRRIQLQPDFRQKIVNKIIEALKKHIPFSGPEGLLELKKVAVRFEEKIYTAAISQTDYLRKISSKMMSMDAKPPSQLGNPSKPSPDTSNQSSADSVSGGIQAQVNQGQQLPMPIMGNQSQGRQQILPQNIQNNMTSTVSVALASIPNVNGQSSNLHSMQTISNVAQNSMPNSMGQGMTSNMFTNTQLQMSGRQHHVVSQQSQNPQRFSYQQQSQPQLNAKFPQGSISQSIVQPHMQQKEQENLLQQSQHNLMQPTPPLSNIHQNQPSTTQQSSQTKLPQHTQPIRQPQHTQQTNMVHQQTSLTQQPILASQPQQRQPQQQIIGQPPSGTNIQQSQMMTQPNSTRDMLQQPAQPQGMIGQQSNMSSMQQQLLNQQGNLSNMHKQQFSKQNNVGGLQHPEIIGRQSSNSGMPSNQQNLHMVQQSRVTAQQPLQQSAGLVPTQGRQSQQMQLPQQQLMSQIQSQPAQRQQQIGNLQQQANTIQRDLQQRLQTSSPMLHHQNLVDPHKQIFQPQRKIPDGPSTSLDSTAQTGGVHGGDWQDEAYHKIRSMKNMYFLELNEMYQKVASKLELHNLPQQPNNMQLDKLRVIKTMLEKLLQFLRLNKNDIQIAHRDKIGPWEKQIVNILKSNRPGSSLPQGQLPQSRMHAIQQNQQLQSQISQMQRHESQMSSQMQSVGSVVQMQQNNHASLQHNSLSPASNISSQLQQNSNMIPHQQLKQKQHLKQLEPRQPFLHRQQMLQQQQQQQTKQQQPAQLPSHNMSQIYQKNETSDTKTQQQMGIKSGILEQHHPAGQRAYHPQLKSGSSFISSPPPQVTQHLSPQIDQRNMPTPIPKDGTPLQSLSSPFTNPSPSTPLAPSPMLAETEKLNTGVSPLSHTGTVGHQQSTFPSVPAQSVSIGTPEISASPLLAGVTSRDGTHGFDGKSASVERAHERLMRAVKCISSKALTAAVSDISSVVSMVDSVAGSAPGNGSTSAVGEDLAAMTKRRLPARNFSTQEDQPRSKKMRRYISALPSTVSSAGSVRDSFRQKDCSEASELESTATSCVKRPLVEANHALLEEMQEINRQLMDTTVEISNEDIDHAAAVSVVEGGEGTIVKCSYNAVTLSSDLKALYASAQMARIQPLQLLVPINYPHCSLILLDKFPVEVSAKYEDLSVKAKSKFSISIRSLSQPMSLANIARTWDVCAREVITEYAQQRCGGTFSSKYGTWENCLSAA